MSRDIPHTIRELQLNPSFTAWDANLDGAAPWPFRDRWHRFTQPDGPDAHDHPFGIEVYIPRDGGGYVEEIFEPRDGGGFYNPMLVTRAAGTSFYIPAGRVHRIAELLAPVVWTHVITGPWEREWRVYPEMEIRNTAPVERGAKSIPDQVREALDATAAWGESVREVSYETTRTLQDLANCIDDDSASKLRGLLR